MSKYAVRDHSQSGHCCFVATVVDTTKPEIIGGEQFEDHCEAICECFTRAEADLIAAVLNAAESP